MIRWLQTRHSPTLGLMGAPDDPSTVPSAPHDPLCRAPSPTRDVTSPLPSTTHVLPSLVRVPTRDDLSPVHAEPPAGPFAVPVLLLPDPSSAPHRALRES